MGNIYFPRQQWLRERASWLRYTRFARPTLISGSRREVTTALFWVITQRVVVISYLSVGTAYRSHLQGSRIKIP